ncbi:VPS10 domain-containing protein [Eilatimonas milleporae]|uniref:Photosystem II stability/assembly factor-like uncharacterized protein n=1 Tax=Eilatimonas milleporae TaxID=911205 RepID=A0A3M0D6T4_9PROT|nr:glycosyl hydrolase [Eilatimonas milleporae]RMB11983.1 photosystem II stability/assembly factor-like uncharacterized protein [Eilatimonas milleporae]
MRLPLLAAAIVSIAVSAPFQPSWGQSGRSSGSDAGPMTSATFDGMKLRNIGPAFMSGRIADIEIVPDDPSTWYVAVGSGGVWKTTNAATTWTPLFDSQSVYSIGTIALEPGNANSVWVGTGENVGGRHVSFGDGIYHSRDGGKTWTKKGLEQSGHISEIIIHPDDPDTLWAAVQGPLWSKGGQRGLFKTTDGGDTWRNVLSAGAWTGVTDLVIDPRNPDRLYAATWQRHRTVAAYMGGGPESGIHMSEDGGETWTRLEGGLPTGNLGKIGLAISPMKPDVLYAAIELNRRTGGIWKSTNRGASWAKQSDAVGGGTGPHYYQELIASPHAFDRLYMVSNTTEVSDDGGRTMRPLNNDRKHGDDHAVAFRPDDPDYLLVGSDGGLYESFDLEKSWRYVANLPITQFYKVAVDDAAPFYNVYGGTQDNSTQGGPSRTDDLNGITNADWFITLFADGHQPATEPGNPDIMYSQWQQGNLARIDRITGEIIHIQPQAAPGEPAERFNWDAPILVSAHQPTRIYHGSQRLWRSDDRGDTWTAVSGDLTRNQQRISLPLMDRQWSWDAPWDVSAMSNYNTITSIAESPMDENILYVGTDDGLIQVTTDGGQTWRRIEAGRLPGVPDTAFVNDIKADLFDADTVYIALDNHKYGDYKPYLLKSTDRGRRWTSIAGSLPDKHLVWRVVQDHVNPNLMFAGTEFGLFFTPDGGGNWIELNGDVPTISFRDLAIQRRENDLVAASFGRGFFILDDYAPLRGVTADSLKDNALLFPPSRKTWWYMEQHGLGFEPGAYQGHAHYRAPNPPFGAVFTYYLADSLKTLAEQRQEAEKPAIDAGEDVPFPGFDAVEAERRETKPEVWLTVRNADGTVVRRVPGAVTKGFHRIAWDLRYPPTVPVGNGRREEPEGFHAAPGRYTATLSSRVRGVTTELAAPVSFEVTRLRQGALKGAEPADVVAFWEELDKLDRSISAARVTLRHLNVKADQLKTALARSRTAPAELDDRWQAIRTEIDDIGTALTGNRAMAEIGELEPATVSSRLSQVMVGTALSTYGPTPSHRENFGHAQAAFADLRTRLNRLTGETIPAFEAALIDAGAPWVPGSPIPPAR